MLSPKKERFVDFIRSFTEDNNRPPTFVEIMRGLNYSSLGTINWYIVELEREGIISRVKGFNGKRALSLLENNITNQLPLLGVISAGMPIETYKSNDFIEVPSSFYNKDNFVLKVNGDSMIEDGILDGDYIIAKKSDVANPGDTVVVTVNGEATLKRYYIGSNGIELHPRNSMYNIIYINEMDELSMQGLVVGIFRKY